MEKELGKNHIPSAAGCNSSRLPPQEIYFEMGPPQHPGSRCRAGKHVEIKPVASPT
jgi:hypothetical protein